MADTIATVGKKWERHEPTEGAGAFLSFDFVLGPQTVLSVYVGKDRETDITFNFNVLAGETVVFTRHGFDTLQLAGEAALEASLVLARRLSETIRTSRAPLLDKLSSVSL